MNEPHLVGINEAARLTGKNKATISRDTKSGRLSSIMNDDGKMRRYQVSELERVYGTLRSPDTGYAPVANHQSQPVKETSATSALPEVVKAKDEVISLLKEQVEDLRKERDNWREQALRVLPAPTETMSAPDIKPEKRGFWPFKRKAAV